jgi:hypothetical protein
LLSAAELVCKAEVVLLLFDAVAAPLVLASPFAPAAVLLGLFAFGIELLQRIQGV